MSDFQIVAGGDACLAIEFPPAIDEALTLRCASIARDIGARHVAVIHDIVPTFHTVAVYFDPRRIHLGTLEALLRECAGAPAPADVSEGRIVEVPVRYGGEFGPDLPAVASFGRCTEGEVVRIHSARIYRVFMLGFLPGFAYMGHVDERIAAPRLETPRARVPAGSVAIAGQQTAVYPLDSPGGWQIIGRTSLTMFDRDRPDPFLLQSADRVKFVPVDEAGVEQSLR
jgi:KipI family sensor histidine kinase inhibitor